MCIAEISEAQCGVHLTRSIKKCRTAKRTGIQCPHPREKHYPLVDGLIPCPRCSIQGNPGIDYANDGIEERVDFDLDPPRGRQGARPQRRAPQQPLQPPRVYPAAEDHAYANSEAESEEDEPLGRHQYADQDGHHRHHELGQRPRRRVHRHTFYEEQVEAPDLMSGDEFGSEDEGLEPNHMNYNFHPNHRRGGGGQVRRDEHVGQPMAHRGGLGGGLGGGHRGGLPGGLQGGLRNGITSAGLSREEANHILAMGGWKGQFY